MSAQPPGSPGSTIKISEGRFARLEAIEWWEQSRLAQAKVLVIGAGALGNEVIKNLALLGVGHVAIVDMDRVELSNLSRSILFREADEGRLKVDCAAEAARSLYGQMKLKALAGNVLSDVGLGHFRWADVVVGALDNREARVFVNAACARVGRPWFDGGIEVLHGIVRGFKATETACYECTMSRVDWDLLNKRRSCSLLARRAIEQRGTPTTPITASVIGAMQASEAVKYLHGHHPLLGGGFVLDGVAHNSYRINYTVDPDCPWHEPMPRIHALENFHSGQPLRELWAQAQQLLGQVDALDLAREIVERMQCPGCGRAEAVLTAAERLAADQLLCPDCGKECVPQFLHSLRADSEWLDKSAAELGLPAWDILWARNAEECIGLEIAGDNPWKTDEAKGPENHAQKKRHPIPSGGAECCPATG